MELFRYFLMSFLSAITIVVSKSKEQFQVYILVGFFYLVDLRVWLLVADKNKLVAF